MFHPFANYKHNKDGVIIRSNIKFHQLLVSKSYKRLTKTELVKHQS